MDTCCCWSRFTRQPGCRPSKKNFLLFFFFLGFISKKRVFSPRRCTHGLCTATVYEAYQPWSHTRGVPTPGSFFLSFFCLPPPASCSACPYFLSRERFSFPFPSLTVRSKFVCWSFQPWSLSAQQMRHFRFHQHPLCSLMLRKVHEALQILH